jgi:hypothetical protein
VRAPLLALFAVVLGLAGALASCSSIAADRRIGVDAPDEGSFSAPGSVGDFLERRCGTLECHGQMGRNLRIWGATGMRLSDADIPAFTKPTTADEYRATYRSLVGLEPTVMSAVVDGRGGPELLTFVRKARGLEAHKGGQLIMAGDDQDVCVTSWLSGKINTMACQNASNYAFTMFPMPDASTR